MNRGEVENRARVGKKSMARAAKPHKGARGRGDAHEGKNIAKRQIHERKSGITQKGRHLRRLITDFYDEIPQDAVATEPSQQVCAPRVNPAKRSCIHRTIPKIHPDETINLVR